MTAAAPSPLSSIGGKAANCVMAYFSNSDVNACQENTAATAA